MKDVFEAMLTDIAGGLGSFLGLRVDDVLKSPAAFSPSGQSLVDTVSKTIVMPVAGTILVVLFFIELTRVAVQVDGNSEMFVKRGFFTLVKFAIIYWLFTSWPTVMKAIYSILAEIARKTDALTSSTTGSGSPDLATFLEGVEQLDFLGQAILLVLFLLAWIVNKGAVIMALALVVQRFVKLFIFGAFAPMPFAFFAEDHTRSWGIGFLRNYAATVLQSMVLVLAFAIYQAITQGWAADALSQLNDFSVQTAFSVGGTFIFVGAVLATIILGSGRLANELLGN